MNETSCNTGNIFDIQRMSLHDGPGIRTTIFMKGCSLHCFWCQNPEGIHMKPEIQFFPDRCIGCGECASVCRLHQVDIQKHLHNFQRADCVGCGRCASVCPAGSLVLSGKEWSVDALLEEALRDRPFYGAVGGVTVSGGEPLLQYEFITKFLQRLQEEGVHTAVESALNVPFSAIESVRPYVSLFIIDMKHPDNQKHKKYTGCGNKQILKNIRSLDDTDSDYKIRIPVVPGVNDDLDTMNAFDRFFSSLKRIYSVELMPYHAFGLGKYSSLDMNTSTQQGLATPSAEHLTELAKALTHACVEFRNGAKIITVPNGGKTCNH